MRFIVLPMVLFVGFCVAVFPGMSANSVIGEVIGHNKEQEIKMRLNLPKLVNPPEFGSNCCNRFKFDCCGGTGPFNPYEQGIDTNEKGLENEDLNLNKDIISHFNSPRLDDKRKPFPWWWYLSNLIDNWHFSCHFSFSFCASSDKNYMLTSQKDPECLICAYICETKICPKEAKNGTSQMPVCYKCLSNCQDNVCNKIPTANE